MALDLPGDVLAMLNTDEFGEQITYWPSGESGDARTIDAIIDRDQVETITGLEPLRSPLVTVTVANDAASGISSAEIDTGTDRVLVPIRYGETATNKGIARIVQHDQGVLVFEVE